MALFRGKADRDDALPFLSVDARRVRELVREAFATRGRE